MHSCQSAAKLNRVQRLFRKEVGNKRCRSARHLIILDDDIVQSLWKHKAAHNSAR